MPWKLIFSGLESPGFTAAVILVVLLCLTVSIALMRYERRLVSAGVGRLLTAFRVITLLLILLALLQPVLTRSESLSESHRVVVAVDVSESMQTADRHAARDEMLRWGVALGMIGNEHTRDLILQWADAYADGTQPDFSMEADGTRVPEHLAEARREQVLSTFEAFRTMTRLEFVRRITDAGNRGLIRDLRRNHDVETVLFAGEQQDADPSAVGDSIVADHTALMTDITDASAMLESLLSDESAGTLDGIVLISDGRNTEAGRLPDTSVRLGSLGIPVFSVPVGSRLLPRDAAIGSVELPDSIMEDDTALLRASVLAPGFDGELLPVRLERNGELLEQRDVPISGAEGEVEFVLPESEAGRYTYTLSVASQTEELREDNNSREVSVTVVDSRTRVLLVEGDSRWEFRYLMNALERDAQVDLTSVLFRQPFLGLLNKPGVQQQLPDGEELRQLLAETDVLILGDVLPADLPEAKLTAIETAVEEDGMTLVVVPGRRAMPHAFDSETLLRLLPVQAAHQVIAEQLIRTLPDQAPVTLQLQPTAVAEDLAMFRLSDVAGGGESFSSLPGHLWAYPGTASPAATVWAELRLSVPGPPLRETGTIVHQYYGFGQTLWLGIDSTWRWRRRNGDRIHHRFWGQLVRWAAANKTAAGNDSVRISLRESVVSEKDPVEVTARFSPRFTERLANATVRAVFVPEEEPNTAGQADSDNAQAGDGTQEPDGGDAVTLVLTPDPQHKERFRGIRNNIPPGSWSVQLDVEGTDIPVDTDIAAQLIVTEHVSTELANVSCDRDLLQQVSNETGGRLLEPWELDELQELLRPQETSSERIHERTLFDHWGLMLLLFSLMTCEWVVRKINGLP